MIYILEDDDSIRELVVYTLTNTGLAAKGFERPSLFWEEMNRELPELILLDIMLPEEDGLHILKRLRSLDKTKGIPVIMLTAKDTEYDKVVGLDGGADDYVSKPFGMMELISRIKAVRRRTKGEGKAEKVLSAGVLEVNCTKHIVLVNHQEVTLTLKEFELLCFLLENKGIVFTRDQLLNRIWGYEFDGESRTVDVHVRTLRQKLGDCGKYIETVRGVGYRVGGENSW
ncbi:MAG: response regulator transcription factor [Clostridiales bacterium]|nr:response regulator transcription factor [Clostridiales bacterium]